MGRQPGAPPPRRLQLAGVMPGVQAAGHFCMQAGAGRAGMAGMHDEDAPHQLQLERGWHITHASSTSHLPGSAQAQTVWAAHGLPVAESALRPAGAVRGAPTAVGPGWGRPAAGPAAADAMEVAAAVPAAGATGLQVLTVVEDNRLAPSPGGSRAVASQLQAGARGKGSQFQGPLAGRPLKGALAGRSHHVQVLAAGAGPCQPALRHCRWA